MYYQIGEVASRAMVTVKTLHYYEKIALLKPSQKSEAGYRLYSEKDILRLEQIRRLQHFGLSLRQIKKTLDSPDFDANALIEKQIAAIENQQANLSELLLVLKKLRQCLMHNIVPDVDVLFNVMEIMTMYEKYYTKEQLAELQNRRVQYSQEEMDAFQKQWVDLYADFKKLMDKGVSPSSIEANVLAKKALALIGLFSGGQKDTETSLETMSQKEGGAILLRKMGMDVSDDLYAYVQKAKAAAK